MYQPLHVYQPTPAFPFVPDRRGYLLQQVIGRSVLHVGCTDAPLTADRIAAGQLLHPALRSVAAELLGIDISTDGLNLLRQHGSTDVLEHDAEHLNLGRTFDVILAGDVLEHLNNPGLFLSGAKRHLAPNGTLIIGVPSALTFAVLRAWRGFEQVHPDHTFYFSPKTLGELCARHGLLPKSLVFTVQPADPYASKAAVWIRHQLVSTWPRVAPSLIMQFQHAEAIDKTHKASWA